MFLYGGVCCESIYSYDFCLLVSFFLISCRIFRERVESTDIPDAEEILTMDPDMNIFQNEFKNGIYMELKVIGKIRTNNFNDEHVMSMITGIWKKHQLFYLASMTMCIVYIMNMNLIVREIIRYASLLRAKSSIIIPHDTKHEIFKVDTSDEQSIFITRNEIWKKEDEGLLIRGYF